MNRDNSKGGSELSFKDDNNKDSRRTDTLYIPSANLILDSTCLYLLHDWRYPKRYRDNEEVALNLLFDFVMN